MTTVINLILLCSGGASYEGLAATTVHLAWPLDLKGRSGALYSHIKLPLLMARKQARISADRVSPK